eukprot:9157044-Alexandrium_andersonii.AAC.1
MRAGCNARAAGAVGWNAGRRAHDCAGGPATGAAATAAGRGRTQRAAVLRHAEQDGPDRQAASGSRDAAGSVAS